jgi:hypothetical protein
MIKKISLLLLSIGLIPYASIAQCPMCRSAVESSIKGGSKAVGMGLNTGILMLLGTVYGVLFTVAILWYVKHKRAVK